MFINPSLNYLISAWVSMWILSMLIMIIAGLYDNRNDPHYVWWERFDISSKSDLILFIIMLFSISPIIFAASFEDMPSAAKFLHYSGFFRILMLGLPVLSILLLWFL